MSVVLVGVCGMKPLNPNRVEIPLKAIRQAIKAGKPVSYLRYNFGISERLCQKIAAGEEITHYIKRPRRSGRKEGPGLCTHCRREEKAPGHHWTCRTCHRNNTDGERRAAV